MSDEESAAQTALVPVRQQVVDFYGDAITGVLVQPGGAPAQWYVPLRPLCEYLGLTWPPQFTRTKSDPVLGPALISVTIIVTEMPGRAQSDVTEKLRRGQGRRTLLCLPLEYLPGWLFGINAGRMRDEAMADKITRYRRECYRVLWHAFEPALLPQVLPDDPRLRDLATQIDQLTGTVTFLREHMADIVAAAGQITDISVRLDQAVSLLEGLTQQQQALAARQDVTEAQVERIDERTAHLTPGQKRQVQAFVELMVRQTQTRPQPLTYAIIYGRVKTRFHVGSYLEVPDTAFDDLMAYLREMLRHTTGGAAPEQGQLF